MASGSAELAANASEVALTVACRGSACSGKAVCGGKAVWERKAVCGGMFASVGASEALLESVEMLRALGGGESCPSA